MSETEPCRLYALYESASGDRWRLGWRPATDRLFVLHDANAASGGASTEYDAEAFLGRDVGSPQHQTLLRLIAAAGAT